MKNDAYRLRRIANLGSQLSSVIESKRIDRTKVMNDLEAQYRTGNLIGR